MAGDSGRAIDDEQRTEPHDESPSRPTANRRTLLTAGGGVAATLLAGCSGMVPGGGDGNTTDTGNGTDTSSASATATEETATATPTPEVDVVSLQYRSTDSGYQFIVTLDPPEETPGADWWQLETLGGEKLFRHTFDEPTGSDRAKTTETVSVDSDAVVVRGHDASTGYGGQVMLANLAEGFIALEKQGSEPSSFENYSFEN